jgi:hypothetical protein
MPSTIEPMLSEFREEAATTKRALERVPADKLGWKPHPRSMSLGQLSLHIATIPSQLSRLSQLDGFDVTQGNFDPPHPKNMAEVLAAHEQSVLDAEKCLQGDDRTTGTGQLAFDAEGPGDFQQTPRRHRAIDHAESLVPPSGTAVSLSAPAGCAGSGDLRPQRRREPLRLKSAWQRI